MSVQIVDQSKPAPVTHTEEIRLSVRSYAISGLAICFVMFGGAVLWSLLANLEGAVVSSGIVVVQSNLRKIQHPSGGIIGEILVQDGQVVNEGDILIRLDETVTRANLRIIRDQLAQLSGRQSRLEAERDGAATISFEPELLDNPDAASTVQGETALFRARLASRMSQQAQLSERIVQLREEITGQTEQVESKRREIDLIRSELTGVESLYKTNLVPLARLTALQREETRLTGERGQIVAQTAATRGKISETELQILNIDKDLQAEVTRDLRDVEAKTMELRERRITAEDQLRRIVLYSPVAGVVHQLNVHTVGGVIQAGEQLMLIVPRNDSLTIEAKIAPTDIGAIKIDGLAHLKFVAFDARKTPELTGRISVISADLVQPQPGSVQTQQAPYYNVRIELTADEVDKLDGKHVVPGMPVEVFIATEQRTAFGYLAKPIIDQFSRTFREK